MKQFTKLEDRHHFIAGGIAGCLAKSFVAPFDRVKILFQTKSPLVTEYSGKFFGVFGAIKAIYQEYGIIGLYRGHSMTLLRIFPYASIQFSSYERYKQLFSVDQYPNDQLRRFLSGAAAGITAVTFTYPFDIFRTRLVYLTKEPDNIRHSLSDIYRQLWKEKYAFYQGYPATLVGIFFYAGSSFYTFESVKKYLISTNSPLLTTTTSTAVSLRVLPKFCCGMLAGLAGQTVAYPFDVVRRRIQLKNVSHSLSSYSSLIPSIMRVWRQEGLRGFFVGLTINYLKIAPSTGISFLTYEFLKEKLANYEI